MAWLCSLQIECGKSEENARLISEHFKTHILYHFGNMPCSMGIGYYKIGNAWWVDCLPDGLSRSGIRDENDQKIMDIIGLSLYDHLKQISGYRFALYGIEVDEFRTYEELDLDDIKNDSFTGLVISNEIWSKFGNHEKFIRFSDTHVWRPFIKTRDII